MEAKCVIISVLIMSLVVAQIQVEALKVCCKTSDARRVYQICKFSGNPRTCAKLSGCKIVDKTCPAGYDHDVLESSGDAVNEYCQLGCASSVCDPMTFIQSSDASEIVNEAVEQCTSACSTFCTNGSNAEVETA